MRQALIRSIDPLAPDTHPDGQLVNIVTGQIAQENVNVWNAVTIGTNQLEAYEKSWPDGFYQPISKEVFTFMSKKRQNGIQGKPAMNPEAIYAQAIGLILSDRQFEFEEIISYKLRWHPPAYFKEDGEMRFATMKSALRNAIGSITNKRLFGIPTTIIVDVSAFLWTVKWPSKGKLIDVLIEVKRILKDLLKESDVHWIDDRYRPYSTKSASRVSREENASSRSHQLRPDMPILEKQLILKSKNNKERMNKLIYDSIVKDHMFLKQSTENHRLIIMNNSVVPLEIYKGKKLPNFCLASSHEEADIIVAKHAILCGKEDNARIKVISDDTDVFALLCHFYHAESLETPMVMESPIKGRHAYDLRDSALNHPQLISKILATHAVSGCDTVPATYGIGKPTALKAALTSTFLKIGNVEATVEEVLRECTDFFVKCYASTPCKSMTECRQKQWAIKTGKSISSAPKLCSLPPTTEAFTLNVLRAHFQLCHWYAALDICPPELNPLEHGFEADHVNKILMPRPLPEDVQAAPDLLLKMIKCCCGSAQSCKGGNCGCSRRQIPCTMFCSCTGGDNCHNIYKTRQVFNENDSSDSESDDD